MSLNIDVSYVSYTFQTNNMSINSVRQRTGRNVEALCNTNIKDVLKQNFLRSLCYLLDSNTMAYSWGNTRNYVIVNLHLYYE